MSNEEMVGVNLSEFIGRVSVAVRGISSEWVRAEVASVQVKPRYTRLDLVESDENGNQVAKCQCAFFGAALNHITDTFKSQTGEDIKNGMKILVKVRPQLNSQYGFSLVGLDIDPRYTLGDMEAQKRRILETMRAKGIVDRNKQLPEPVEFTRVAVISPDNAAGLGDFSSQGDILAKFGLCKFDYFTAVFQGPDVKKSFKTAFYQLSVAIKTLNYDAVVIIRGGGAASDLNYLNEMYIAECVCRCPVPVFVGVGHEQDRIVLDDLANQSFHTPSKVIARIEQVIVRNAQEAQKGHERALKMALHLIDRYEHAVANLLERSRSHVRLRLQRANDLSQQRIRTVYSSARTCVSNSQEKSSQFISSSISGAKRNVLMSQQSSESYRHRVISGAGFQLRTGKDRADSFYESICRQSGHLCGVGLERSNRLLNRIALATRAATERYLATLQTFTARTTFRSTSLCESAQDQIHSTRRIIQGYDPQERLNQGYSLMTGPNGHVIKRVEDALMVSVVKMRLSDGTVKAQVTDRSE